LKSYHHLFVEAQNLIDKEYLDYKEFKYWKVERLAHDYYDDIGDKMIILTNSDESKILKIPYISRLSSKYAYRIKKRLKRVKEFLNNNEIEDYAYMITLTLDPKRFFSIKYACIEISKSWNKLNTLLKKYGLFGYFKVIEFQHDTHYPHIHAIILLKNRIEANWLRDIWNKKYGMGIFVNIQKVQSRIIIKENKEVLRLGAGNYIFKYLTKYGYEGNRINDNNVMAWATQVRTYSISKSLLYLISCKTNSNSNDKDKWHIIGIYPLIYYDEINKIEDLYMLYS
jgi:hypothetical protein